MELWRLEHIQVSCGTGLRPTATVRLRGPDGIVREDAAIGTGPVDSVYKAINRITQVPNELTEFSIKAVTEGIDAVGEVTIRIEPTAEAGGNGNGDAYLTQAGPRARTYSGHGADMDIIVASAKAYMSALNKMLTVVKAEAKTESRRGRQGRCHLSPTLLPVTRPPGETHVKNSLRENLG